MQPEGEQAGFARGKQVGIASAKPALSHAIPLLSPTCRQRVWLKADPPQVC